MIRLLLLLAASAILALGQNTSIIQGQWPGETTLVFRDGSNNQQYICTALSIQPAYTWSGSSLITSIVDAGTTATITFAGNHGLSNDNRIFILGMTSAGTTALNAAAGFKVTVSSATVVTITTSGVTDGNYTPTTDPAMAIWTTAPRSNAGIWYVIRQYFTGNLLDRIANAEGDISPGKICDNRATYGYQ